MKAVLQREACGSDIENILFNRTIKSTKTNIPGKICDISDLLAWYFTVLSAEIKYTMIGRMNGANKTEK